MIEYALRGDDEKLVMTCKLVQICVNEERSFFGAAVVPQKA